MQRDGPLATHPLFLEHLTGAYPENGRHASQRSPTHRPEFAEAVVPPGTAAGDACRSGAGAPAVVPRPPRAPVPPGADGSTPTRRRSLIVIRRGARRRSGSDHRGGAATGRGTAPSLCVLRATTPHRPTRWGSAWCPTSRLSPRRSPSRRAGVDLRLRRAPRQWHSGGVLRRPASCSSAPTNGRCIPARGGARDWFSDDVARRVNVPYRRTPLVTSTSGRSTKWSPRSSTDFAPTWHSISAGFDAHHRRSVDEARPQRRRLPP